MREGDGFDVAAGSGIMEIDGRAADAFWSSGWCGC
jgi:hypothetical protein